MGAFGFHLTDFVSPKLCSRKRPQAIMKWLCFRKRREAIMNWGHVTDFVSPKLQCVCPVSILTLISAVPKRINILFSSGENSHFAICSLCCCLRRASGSGIGGRWKELFCLCAWDVVGAFFGLPYAFVSIFFVRLFGQFSLLNDSNLSKNGFSNSQCGKSGCQRGVCSSECVNLARR